MAVADATRGAPATRGWQFPWVALLDHVDWITGKTEPLPMNIGLSVPAIYQRLSASQASLGGTRSFGDLLLVVLLFVSGLFLIIEVGRAGHGARAGAVDHRLGARAVRRHRARAPGRLRPPHPGARARISSASSAESFNQMTASIEDLLRQAAEKKRLEEELRLAREIQMSLLPRGPLLVPGHHGQRAVRAGARGGRRLLRLVPLPDGRYGVLIADVSGKGMSAALYMAELKGLMLSLSQIHSSPRDLLISANRLISSTSTAAASSR